MSMVVQIDKVARWGDLESDEEESSEEEEEEDEDEEATVRGDDEESLADGLASVGGVSSLPSGLETPEVIDLRKAKAGGMGSDLLGYQCFDNQVMYQACVCAQLLLALTTHVRNDYTTGSDSLYSSMMCAANSPMAVAGPSGSSCVLVHVVLGNDNDYIASGMILPLSAAAVCTACGL